MVIWVPITMLLLVSCVTDFLYRKIPNILLIVVGAYGLIASAFGAGDLVFINSVLGLLTGLLIFMFPHYKSWIGAGDVKLMGVIGIYLGPSLTIITSIYSMLVGGVIALLYLLYRGNFQESMGSILGFKTSQGQMPYAAAISIGAVLAVLTTQNIQI